MTNSENPLIGLHAPQFLERLVNSNPEIMSLELFRSRTSLPIQSEKGLTPAELTLVNEALEWRESTGLPFWDALFLKASGKSHGVDKLLLRAQLHNEQQAESFSVARENCNAATFEDAISSLPINRVLAVSSRVRSRNNDILHIPMIDFHCAENSSNDRLVKSSIHALGLEGYIAKSGRSYHFYGRRLVSVSELISILARALLLAPIVDRAWIAHQLLERACGLRISPGKAYSTSPIIFCEV